MMEIYIFHLSKKWGRNTKVGIIRNPSYEPLLYLNQSSFFSLFNISNQSVVDSCVDKKNKKME